MVSLPVDSFNNFQDKSLKYSQQSLSERSKYSCHQQLSKAPPENTSFSTQFSPYLLVSTSLGKILPTREVSIRYGAWLCQLRSLAFLSQSRGAGLSMTQIIVRLISSQQDSADTAKFLIISLGVDFRNQFQIVLQVYFEKNVISTRQ